jgi:hypothetical protein
VDIWVCGYASGGVRRASVPVSLRQLSLSTDSSDQIANPLNVFKLLSVMEKTK